MFHRRQLRFISCHKEQIHWLYQFNGLVEMFDLEVWVVLIILAIALSHTLTYVPVRLNKTKTQCWYSTKKAFVHILATFMDQSSELLVYSLYLSSSNFNLRQT